MMVCKQAEQYDACVQIAALLHDIGKPICRETVNRTKRVRFFNHEAVSAFMALDIMKALDLPEYERRLIFQMIAMHTEPFKLTPKQVSERMVANPELYDKLIALSTADREGRFFSNKEEVPAFPTPPDRIFDRTKTKEAVIMIGLPCSGKSTYIEEFLPNHAKLSRDHLVETHGKGKTYNEKWKNVDQDLVTKYEANRRKELIASGNNFVADMTHMSRKSRRRILSQLDKGWHKKAVVLLPPLLVIHQRNSERDGKTITSEVFEFMIKRFYPPLYDEFDEIVWELS